MTRRPGDEPSRRRHHKATEWRPEGRRSRRARGTEKAPDSRPGPVGRRAVATRRRAPARSGSWRGGSGGASVPRARRLTRPARAGSTGSGAASPPSARPRPCGARSCTGASAACTSARGRPSGWAGRGSRRRRPRGPRCRTGRADAAAESGWWSRGHRSWSSLVPCLVSAGRGLRRTGRLVPGFGSCPPSAVRVAGRSVGVLALGEEAVADLLQLPAGRGDVAHVAPGDSMSGSRPGRRRGSRWPRGCARGARARRRGAPCRPRARCGCRGSGRHRGGSVRGGDAWCACVHHSLGSRRDARRVGAMTPIGHHVFGSVRIAGGAGHPLSVRLPYGRAVPRLTA